VTRPPTAVATFGRLAELDAKMAHGVLRYCDHVVAVIDPVHAGARLREILPYARRDLPIVATLDDAPSIEEVVIGASPPGGAAADGIVELAARALARGLWVVHGLHTSFANAPGIAEHRSRLVELRHAPVPEVVASGAAARLERDVVLAVGSDCASGKMTAALELRAALGRRAAFIATGQTGMYIAGIGAPIDAIRADFVAGVVERLVVEAAADHDVVLVEGQGSILHPAYSGVTLSLLHGSAPNLLVFCHDLGRTRLAYFDRAIADLAGQIALIERLASTQRPARVVAVAAMARGIAPAEARRACAALQKELRLPVHLTDSEAAQLAAVVGGACSR
jgi:uncharacterized NAD-dependent epimerase/dehydratase family protein